MKEGDRVQTPHGIGTIVDFRMATHRWVVLLDEPSKAGWVCRHFLETELEEVS